MGMQQPGTDYSTKAESGERTAKGADAADHSPSGSKTNGVAMGKADATGRSNGGKDTGEFNTGTSSKTCYTHRKGA